MRRYALILSAVTTALTPAVGFAQEAPDTTPAALPKKGFVLKDCDGKKVGTIDMVRSNSTVTFIRDMRIYQVPLSTVTTGGRISTTSMSWAEIRG
jgi:hypothetical protein